MRTSKRSSPSTGPSLLCLHLKGDCMFHSSHLSGPLSARVDVEKLGRFQRPNMISIPGGPFLMGTSPEDIKQLQLKESDWAYDWYDNNLFVSEQPQRLVEVDPFEIAQY